jgi:hypothetical protein
VAESAGKIDLVCYHSGMKNTPNDPPADAPPDIRIAAQQAAFAQKLCAHTPTLQLDAPAIAEWLVLVWKLYCDQDGISTVFIEMLKLKALDLLCRYGGRLGRPLGEPTPHVLKVIRTGAQTPYNDIDEHLMGFISSGLQLAFDLNLLQANDEGYVRSLPPGWKKIQDFIGAPQPPVVTADATAPREDEDTTGKGVSFRDAAALFEHDGDQKSISAMVTKWNKSRQKKPKFIGYAPEHSQTKLYAPTALKKFVEKIERDLPKHFSIGLKDKARFPRQKK